MQDVFSERRVLALIILLLAIGLTLSTFGLEFAELGGAFSPMFFPRIILMILLGLAALNVLLELTTSSTSGPIAFWRVAIISAGFMGYVLLIVPLGYFISSVLLSLLVLLTLGLRNPLMLFAVPVGASGALVGLFNHVLRMPLPTSPFVWWI
jgi:hypothetical protein